MVGKIGLFGTVLVVGSGILAAVAGGAMTFSHPLGIFGAMVVFFFWTCFFRLVVLVYTFDAPLMEYRGEPEEEVFVPLPPGGLRSRSGKTLIRGPVEETPHRILGARDRGLMTAAQAPARTRLRVSQESPETAEAEQRREDVAWADMFRAL